MDIILNRFYKFLIESVPNIVVKIPSQAKANETLDSKKNGDTYVSAMMGTDSIISYCDASDGLMEEAGYTSEEIAIYKENEKDPTSLKANNKRKNLQSLARQKFIDNYEETNNYYRMLNGKPDYESEDEIWFDDFEIYDSYGIEPCAVHEIPHTILNAMEARGELDGLKKAYPEAQYLNYLGKRRIDYVSARRGDSFELLYFPNTSDCYSFYRDFVSMYESCREYFLTVIYNQYFMAKYEQYDGLIGFMILTMTINKIIDGNFKAFIDRDFYDSLSVATFLNAYGIYYDDRLTLSQTKLIAKNLNILLMNKSTDVAMLDVLDLLGFHDYTLMKYYLVKSHKFTLDGPVFMYKTITDEDGSEKKVLDTDAMYNYNFIKVPVGETNIQDALNESENKFSYSAITDDDPYWITDKELLEKMKNTTFNYIDTKYMDLTIVYRMYAIMFETQYFTRLILDRKKETQNILINMAKLSNADIPIYDIMIMLICLVCKFYKFTPVILKSPDKILRLLGFNFEADIEAIIQDIKNNPRVYDQSLLSYLTNPILINTSDINEMYGNIKKFDRKLISLMNTASTLESYRAYRKLYDTLMYINLNPELYTVADGTVPDTYTQYLRHKNPEIYKILTELEGEDDCSELINYITSRLYMIFTNTKYLKYINIVDDSLIDGILKILCFFKSYTVHMRGAGIIYLFDSRIYNMAHLYHDFNMTGNMNMKDITDSGDPRYWDVVSSISSLITFTEENASSEEIAKAMSDMMHRINVYNSWKMYMKDCHMIIPDKTNIGVLFEIPTKISENMSIDDINMTYKEYYAMFENFSHRINLDTLDKANCVVETRIREYMFSKVSKLFETATLFADQKLNHSERYTFMTKFLRQLMVKVPSRLFVDTNIEIRDKGIPNIDVRRLFEAYENTMDSSYINTAIKVFLSDMICDICTTFSCELREGVVNMTMLNQAYSSISLRLLAECKLPQLSMSVGDNFYCIISDLLHKHDIDVIDKLNINALKKIRQKYNVNDILFKGHGDLRPSEPIKSRERLSSIFPLNTNRHMILNVGSEKVSFRDNYIKFIWAE